MNKHLFTLFACIQLISFATFGQSKLKPHYKGYDIFSTRKYVYIVRTDLGCFLRAKKLGGSNTTKSEIFPLNEALGNAKHYVGYTNRKGEDSKRCAVWENTYSTHKNFGDAKGKVKDIGSPLAKNGDHYFALSTEEMGKVVYVIKGFKYYVFKSLSSTKTLNEGVLPKKLQSDVVAFWGRKKYIYILKNTKERGPLIYRATASILNNMKPQLSSTVSAPNIGVRNFLIGGLTAKKNGGTSAVWKSVSSAFPFCNDS
ncbi:hypothetical protein, partial [Microscilla marina]